MNYYSEIGKPCEVYGFLISQLPHFYFKEFHHKGYHKAGSVLGGFVFPKNEQIESKEQLFSKYRLWENLNGVGLVGLPVTPINILDNTFISEKPVFAGDIWIKDGLFVRSCKGTYSITDGFYRCEVTLGTMPRVGLTIETNLFNIQLLQTLNAFLQNLEIQFTTGVTSNGPVTFPELENLINEMTTALTTLQELIL